MLIASKPQLAFVARYTLLMGAANLVWEVAQLPLYTLWTEATPREIAVAVVHCTLGDLILAVVSITAALPLLGWSGGEGGISRSRLVLLATVLGVAYTIFSEWLNVGILRSWAYSPLMPVVPIVGTGLLPLLQWIVLPPLCLVFAGRRYDLAPPKEHRA